MMSLVPLVLALLVVGNPAGVSEGGLNTDCPPEHPRTRAQVERFLTLPAFADNRKTYGLQLAVQPAVRLLTDAQDAAACRRIAAMFRLGTSGRYPRLASYYTAGGLYFITVTWQVPEGVTYLGHSTLHVLDANLNYKESLAL